MDADALLAATYRGDTRAFESLVRSQAARLHRLASRVTGDGTLADDVLQETFLRVLRVPAAARPSRGAASWLARVTVRVALNLLESERARRRREERYARERSEAMEDGGPTGIALTHELDRPVAEALASLSPETRAALWLHLVEGDGVREVAAFLDSSRSAVSRRIQAGLEALRKRLATSGAALAGVALIRGALRGSETAPAESLLQRILEAGRRAMADEAASPPAPGPLDALDAVLAAPVRSLPSFAGIAAAAFITAGFLAALGGFIFMRPWSDRGMEADRPVVAAPAVHPSNEGQETKSEAKPVEPAPAPPAPEPPVVSGTVRDEAGEPVPSAEVFLALSPPLPEDPMGALGSYFRADYFKRSRFLETRTDDEGRFAFARVPEFGGYTIGAFQEDSGGTLGQLSVPEGAPAKIDLVLVDGATLTGRVLARDGSPVTDAVVSVCQAWSPTDHIFRGAGIGATDAEGRFQLGLGAGTTACHLRVNSDRHGQAFFIAVPVEEEVELAFPEPARVEGKIIWVGGAPASGLTVRVNGRFPEPPIPVERMGMRPFVVHDGLAGADGTYRIEGLHPGFNYDIFIINASLGEREALQKPLTPPFRDFFRLEEGEVKVWDRAVSRPITIRGHIRTELTRTPVREGQVGGRKDGQRLELSSVWTNNEGYFEMQPTTGPGEYRLYAEPPIGLPSSEDAEELIDARFGKTLKLADSEEAEVDLTIFEPAVLPVRVLDAAGKPVKTIDSLLRVILPNGKKLGLDSPRSLDDAGRVNFLLYFPAAEFWCGIGASPGGPAVETRRYASQPGTILPEETIILPRTCDLAASILDSERKAYAEKTVYLRVIYEDGSKESLATRTDAQGLLSEKGRVRAAPFVLEATFADSKAKWKSPRLDGSAGGAIDLGEIVLEAKSD